MQILTTGKNLDIGEALRRHVEARLGEGVGKFFDGTVRAQVVIEKQKNGFRTECSLHLTTGTTLQSHADAPEAFASVDAASDRLKKQLRRYKSRLRDHHGARQDVSVPAAGSVASSSAGEEAE